MKGPSVVSYLCQCRLGQHDLDLKIPEHRMLHKIIDKEGYAIKVTLLGKGTYLVPRLFIAFHGLQGEELPYIGFKRI